MAEKSLQERVRALPKCLQIAFVARCARRVQPLTCRFIREHVLGIEQALSILDHAAQGLDADIQWARTASADAYAYAAAGTIHDCHTAAARTAAYASSSSFYSDPSRAASAAVNTATAANTAAAFASVAFNITTVAIAAYASDIEALENLAIFGYRIVNPSESGPLGRFWVGAETPDWYLPRLNELKSILNAASTPEPSAAPPPPLTAPPGNSPQQELVFEFCLPDDYDESQLQEVVGQLAFAADGYYRALGGPGLMVDSIELEQPVMEVVR